MNMTRMYSTGVAAKWSSWMVGVKSAEPATSAQASPLWLDLGAVYSTRAFAQNSEPLLHFGPLFKWQSRFGG